jgi:hypothetical protein
VAKVSWSLAVGFLSADGRTLWVNNFPEPQAKEKSPQIVVIFLWSGIVENVRAYWQTAADKFSIPQLTATKIELH